MRKTILSVTSSLTASTSTEMLCMQIQEETGDVKYYFIEYPTNIPPNHYNINARGNVVKELSKDDFLIISESFELFCNLKRNKPYLHAPSFIQGYCIGTVDVELFE